MVRICLIGTNGRPSAESPDGITRSTKAFIDLNPGIQENREPGVTGPGRLLEIRNRSPRDPDTFLAWGMAQRTRIVSWNGKDMPAELRELPARWILAFPNPRS